MGDAFGIAIHKQQSAVLRQATAAPLCLSLALETQMKLPKETGNWNSQMEFAVHEKRH